MTTENTDRSLKMHFINTLNASRASYGVREGDDL